MPYELCLNFHVLGVLLLLSPLMCDVCQIIINTYNRLCEESRGSNANIAASRVDRAEAPTGEVVDEKELGLKSERLGGRTVKSDGGEKSQASAPRAGVV